MKHLYIVQIVHTMDDFIAKVFDNFDDSFEFAKSLAENPELFKKWDVRAQKMFGIEASTPCGIRIVYTDLEGEPYDDHFMTIAEWGE